MKVSKSLLKSIVKECLIEILAEGMGNSLVEAVSLQEETLPSQPSRQRPTLPKAPARRLSQAHLDRRVQAPPRTGPSPIEAAIKEGSGGDPILASMLADTARTTLPAMLEGDRSMQGGSAGGVEQITHSPEEIFGEETTSKWADLAFAPRRPGQISLPPPEEPAS
jgi:hypothetical protein